MNKTLNPRRLLVAAAAAMSLASCAPAANSQPAATSAPVAATVQTSVPTAAPANTIAPADTAAPASTQPVRINLNTGTPEQFKTVQGVGDRMVREFTEYRPYSSILQFRQQLGKYVDAATIAGFEQGVYVTVVPNSADAATLQQLPGVDQAVADKLIAARPYASKDDFLKKLAGVVSAEQAAAAAAYVEAP